MFYDVALLLQYITILDSIITTIYIYWYWQKRKHLPQSTLAWEQGRCIILPDIYSLLYFQYLFIIKYSLVQKYILSCTDWQKKTFKVLKIPSLANNQQLTSTEKDFMVVRNVLWYEKASVVPLYRTLCQNHEPSED